MPSTSPRTRTPASPRPAAPTAGSRPPQRRGARAALPVLALVAAVLAGCSSGGTPVPTTPATSSGAPTATPSQVATPQPSPSEAQAPSAPAWPSGPTSRIRSTTPPPELVNVTAGHDVVNELSFDRVVFEFTGGLPGYTAQYVNQVLTPGQGTAMALAGQAFFQIVLTPAAAHDASGQPTVTSPIDGGGLPAIRQIALAGDFEGYVHFGIGLSGVAGYRVTELAKPDRLVFDFAAQATGAP
ncbi:hypothetical protein [Pseudofrankia sp. DC12]|uniref:AMIN-like domain-containing (lipo)protein n=1 Tax=Pseudofrankia sp. DC12 TaxID=683315 RepID=UPI0005F78B7E|nr:hypothetical protein [Pseudofrankia sp. DC12]